MLSINAITDSIKALAQALNVATVFPSALFVLVQFYWVVPQFWAEPDLTSLQNISLAISITLILSYTLYAFNFPLIRFLEGQKWQQTSFFQNLWRNEIERFEDFRRRIQIRVNQIHSIQRTNEQASRDNENDYWQEWILDDELVKLEYRFDRSFPSTLSRVLPTKFGNTIAAFEDYPRTRYGIDSIALWPRLIPILKEKDFIDYVNQEKAVLDFVLNMFIVVIVLGLELMYVYLFLQAVGMALGIGLVSIVIALVLFEGMVIAARQWGMSVRVAFDLYRQDLHQSLGLHPAKSFEEEYNRWRYVSHFILSHRNSIRFNDFISQSELLRQKAPQKQEKQRKMLPT
jgi:hypothetical protein